MWTLERPSIGHPSPSTACRAATTLYALLVDVVTVLATGCEVAWIKEERGGPFVPDLVMRNGRGRQHAPPLASLAQRFASRLYVSDHCEPLRIANFVWRKL